MKKIRRDRQTESDAGPPEFAVQPHQITIALQPGQSIRELIDQQVENRGDIGRPFSIWRDNVQLARMVNDRRAGETQD